MRQIFVRAIGGVALAALVLGGAAACKQDEGGTEGGSASKVCDLKIGFFGALSGGDAGLVTPGKQAADLAVKQYNAEHADCKVSIQAYDSQGKPELAGGLATSAVGDAKVVGIVGPAFSGESETANPIFQQAGLPVITQSATRPSLADNGWAIFHRGVGNDFSQGPAAAAYIKSINAAKVFVVDDQSAYGAGLADEVKKALGATVVASDKATDNQQDFSAIVTKVTSSGATALFYGGYTEEASPFLKQLRAGGYKGTFVGGDGIYDANMLSVTGNADVEGAVATCPCAPATTAKGTFVQDFKAEFNAEPGVYADVAYDLTKIYLEAIGEGKSSRADIQAFLKSYNKAGSATGVTYKWDDKGELDPAQVRVWSYIAKNGAWAPDKEIPKA
ncbi:branched-chain amino acid ABC transporter substrate-binding protein [Asanoa siamensis]|uniref:Branched chain amino acid ABC transporter substrate-binding protein n=1 Tax=Asanoa siamensis TaxID=926357 RepID=A0ABQ4CP29_9ACTN|nr:branched-chain amino acid ABC transporter substrate-binding protein [Asanoa siamensis]GIF72607.1 branched chain amino acid ABC transporter substrate-binding protein [Asanoa siamensis]